MRTVDTEAVITDQHMLMAPVPPDLRPGNYRVVVVIEAPTPDETAGVETTDPSEAWHELYQLGRELADAWPVGVQSAEVLSSMRDER